MTIVRLFAAGLMLALAACDDVPTYGAAPASGKRDRLINIELVGPSECLAGAVHDVDAGLARGIDWKDGIGVMEVGPVEQGRYVELARMLRERSCLRSFRPRPCGTSGTDIAVCTPEDEAELGNGVAVLHPPA
jgi:hypothetical protein